MPGVTISMGPISRQSCRQLLRRIWLYTLNSTVVGYGDSDRGICGAPRGLLAEPQQSVVVGQTASFHIDPIQHAISMDARNGLWASFRDEALSTQIGNQIIHFILITYNDYGDPNLAAKNTERLIRQDFVMSIVGTTGVDTSQAVLNRTKALGPGIIWPSPIFQHVSSIVRDLHTSIHHHDSNIIEDPAILAQAYSIFNPMDMVVGITPTFLPVPLICPHVGSRIFFKPYEPVVVNIRVSYDDELAQLVNNIVNAGVSDVAVIYQNNTFGDESYQGLISLLALKGRTISRATQYRPNTYFNATRIITSISRNIGSGRPSYVILLGDAPYVAPIITAGAKLWPDDDPNYQPVIYAVTSYTHGGYLQQLLAGSHSFIQTQPLQPSSEASIRAASFPKYGWNYDESYLCGYVLHQAMVRSSSIGLVTRDLVMNSIRSQLPYIPRQGVVLGPFLNSSVGSHYTTIAKFYEPGNRTIIGTYPIIEGGVDVFAPGPDTLLFGQSAAYTGVAADLGINMRDGIAAAFREMNDAGGINGRVLTLIGLDDGYVADAALANARVLVEEYNVIGILGSVGTPTAQAMLPYLQSHNVPLLFPFTGARSLRLPFVPLVLNTRASYDDELAAFVKYALGIGKEIFSLMAVDDSYGTAGRTALLTALHNQNLPLMSEGTYPRNTMNISEGLANIAKSQIPPQVIVCIGTALPLALFISQAKLIYPQALFYSVSFVGVEAFAQALQTYNATENVIVTQVMPLASSGATPLLHQRYAKAMASYCGTCPLTAGSLEGYVAGQVLIQTLQRLGPISLSSIQSYLTIKGIHNITTSTLTSPPIYNISTTTQSSIVATYGGSWTNRTSIMSLSSDNDDTKSISLHTPVVLNLVRKWFMDTVYNSGMYSIEELRLGPYTSSTCESNDGDCLASGMDACNQGSRHVFVTRLTNENAAFTWREEIKWRYTMHVDECNVNAILAPEDRLPIVFGQSAALSGMNAQLGRELRMGIRAAFRMINSEPSPGVDGRRLLLVSYDDASSIPRAVINTQAMIQSQRMIAILGSAPTANVQAVTIMLTNAKLPIMGPGGGAREWRTPFNPYIIGLRSSFDDEAAAIIDYCVKMNKTRVAIVVQDTSGGRAIAEGFRLALSYHKLSIYAFSTADSKLSAADAMMIIEYQLGWRTYNQYMDVRNHDAYGNGTYGSQMIAEYAPPPRTSRAPPPDVIVTGGSYTIMGNLINWTQMNLTGYADTWYFSTMFTGIVQLRAMIPPSILQRVPIYLAASIPQPDGPSLVSHPSSSILAPYYEAMAALDPEYDPPVYTQGTLEGYLIGRLAIDTLLAAKQKTTQGFVDAAFSGTMRSYMGYNIGPYVANTCNAGLRDVKLEQITYDVTGHVPVIANFTTGSSSDCGVYQKYIDPPCSVGYRKIYTNPNTLESVCRACSPGYYGPDGSKCFVCPPGSYSTGTAANCTLCERGYFQDRAGQLTCEACPIGSYSTTINSTACTPCEIGALTFTPASTNKSSCQCSPGWYSQRVDGVKPNADQDPDALLCKMCNNPDWINTGCLLSDAGPGPAIRLTIVILTIFSIIFTIVIGIATYYYRKAPVVKAASPPILYMMLGGAMMGYAMNFVAFGYPQRTETCMAQPYLAYTGFSLLFGGLFAKTYRVGRIFNQKHIVKIKITNADLTRVVRILNILFIILIIIWNVIDPAKPQTTDNGQHTFTWCRQNEKVWSLLPIVIAYLVSAYGVYLCYKNRNITSFFNETKHISIILYNTLFVGSVFFAAYMLIVTTEQQATLVLTLGVLVIVDVAIGVLFVPKLLTVYKTIHDTGNNSIGASSSHDTKGETHESELKLPSGSNDGSINLSQLMASHVNLQKKLKHSQMMESKMKTLIANLEDQLAQYQPHFEKGIRLQRIIQASHEKPVSLEKQQTSHPHRNSSGKKLENDVIRPNVPASRSHTPPQSNRALISPQERYRSSSASQSIHHAHTSSLELAVTIRDDKLPHGRPSSGVAHEPVRATTPTKDRLFSSPEELQPKPVRRTKTENSRSRSLKDEHDDDKLKPSPAAPRRKISIGKPVIGSTTTSTSTAISPAPASRAVLPPLTNTTPSTMDSPSIISNELVAPTPVTEEDEEMIPQSFEA